ncbi:MAG: type I restriction enzyme HsdR N-terminal domain-containing protein [Cyclobacteriaceae bacterium]|jgi:type I site-specific restriction endonuclease|nr:type I restriction enzyme HsdR N-terminal domain-containing protein [Cyclobacteriaceae bacterium]
MVELNLPSFEYRIKKTDGKIFIFDEIRKKFVSLTPEEWVRQHVVNYMIVHLKYPRALIRIEGGTHYNQLRKRTDIVVYARSGTPWMVVECKAPSHKVGPATLRQVSVYNVTLRALYIAVTNGITTVCACVDPASSPTRVLSHFPAYD